MQADGKSLDETLAASLRRLLAERGGESHWRGHLSSSAVSTATAVFALSTARSQLYADLIRRGLDWLLAHVNADGGWGDTPANRSNLSATLLAWSALTAGGERADCAGAARRAEDWLATCAGGREPADLAAAVARRYGRDRTFAAPILTMCALAGRLGQGRRAWRHVQPLPFELAACPRSWLRCLHLPVVSYALPALIAIGQARYAHRPPGNPMVRFLRAIARRRTLRVLGEVQPLGGGFLEAAPLTSFVAMSLGSIGRTDGAVARNCRDFLVRTARTDGSWPIDADLATWVTTLSIGALAAGGRLADHLDGAQREQTLDWLLGRQHLRRHPYTDAAPGGWAWSDLPGAVPDADDTAAALLALRRLDPDGRHADRAAAAAAWLMDLQNADGGVPTFCRGWGKLPFDRSGPELTAHAVLALSAWRADLPAPAQTRADRAIREAAEYLRRAQRADGAYLPLWFGNEAAEGEANPTYGAARVIAALAELQSRGIGRCDQALKRAVAWLLGAQDGRGGWGGDAGVPPSIEETAVAVEGLCRAAAAMTRADLAPAIAAGAAWLIERTDAGRAFEPSPIGLYFARLWYAQGLYPVIFTVSALQRAKAVLGNSPA